MNLSEDELIALGIKYRGTIIDECAALEKWIESYIAMYFTWNGERAFEMLELVLDRLTFDSKIGVFEAMLKKKHKDQFKKLYDKLMSELRIIKDERNKFAHYNQHLENSEQIVILSSYRNSHTLHKYTNDDFVRLINRIERCGLIIKELSDDMWDLDESGSPYKP